MPSTSPPSSSAAIALLQGSKGDVLPAVLLLSQSLTTLMNAPYHERINNHSLLFHIVTHQCHQQLCEDLFSPFRQDSTSPMVVHCRYLTTDPVVLPSSPQSTFDNEQELVDILQSILYDCHSLSSPLSLIIGNLFLLQSWILAQRLRIPCLLIHPTIPHCHHSVRRAVLQEYEMTYGPISTDRNIVNDVNLWLWPTLTDQYDSFMDGIDRIMTNMNISFTKDRSYFPPLKVMITMSPTLSSWMIVHNPVVRELMYPSESSNPSVVGYVRSVSSSSLASHTDHLPEPLYEWIQAIKQSEDYHSLVCIDFGSMTRIISADLEANISSFQRLFQTIKQLAGHDDAFHFLVLSHGSPILLQYFEQCSHRIMIYERDLTPFEIQQLYSKCTTVIHHGGMGSLQTALFAGIPQLLVPITYDQPDNAVLLTSLFPDQHDVLDLHAFQNVLNMRVHLKYVLEKLSSPANRLKVGCLGKQFRENAQENGLANGTEITLKAIENYMLSSRK